MNLARKQLAFLRLAARLGHYFRKYFPKQRTRAFGHQRPLAAKSVEKIYIINLDREPDRWSRIKKELSRIQDAFGCDLLSLSERHAAVDARDFLQDQPKSGDVDPFYTLADQLFVEPQPQTLPTDFELEAPIRMSRAEVAVARSHIEVWRRIAQSAQEHALILEDDVWFHPSFARQFDKAWNDIPTSSERLDDFDLLYVSYMEATNGAPKSIVSKNVFRPERGLWFLSGYVLSREGARKLLRALPCRGPVDLWINQQFSEMKVYATKRPIVRQRNDTASTNSYSVLPSLTTIGAIDSEGAALFSASPRQLPVFSFGPANSGLSSLAMALSMLGYRCCSDLDALPAQEMKGLRSGSSDRVFGAYVNVGCLEPMIRDLRNKYPNAKFIVTICRNSRTGQEVQKILDSLEGADVIEFDTENVNAWRILCEHLRCVPPFCSFPKLLDLEQRHVVEGGNEPPFSQERALPKWDPSPWIVEPENSTWSGIQVEPQTDAGEKNCVSIDDRSDRLNLTNWSLRSDTFTGNLALFRPENVTSCGVEGVILYVKREKLRVREYSAGAITSNAEYLFGRFEATFQASDVPGVITGFFLHRNSPHQEIDIEIAGNAPNRLIVNVFYNPGDDGAKFDYGYRGSPRHIELGFDASKGMHQYAIEWTPHEIRWLVDDRLVHRRVLWNPTPIPHLPMKLHCNAWPTRAPKLAGRLALRRLPAKVHVLWIRVRQRGQPLFKKETDSSKSSTDSSNCGTPK
jgi:GR25 family glycosyltransferase involved in LPS biosynthesis